jgi:DNA-binding MarR family transcriptional regulator
LFFDTSIVAKGGDMAEGSGASGADLEIWVQGAGAGRKTQLRLWLRMLAITKTVSQEIRSRLRETYGSTLPQFDLLAQLYREPKGLRLGELSRRTMVTNGNVTGLADRLEAEGLIRRETLDDDRRVTVARLTPHGRERFIEMARAHEGWLKELMADVDDETLQVALAALADVKASARRRAATDEGAESRPRRGGVAPKRAL